ncbi:MAG: tetratricopeptide repeat protein [Anaerolineae bacterium]|nr:tetratricopeptide repeat protein [Anaerolineae bacterium]
MQIKRDYSQFSFSSNSSRRRRIVGGRFLFFYGMLIGGFLIFVWSQFDRLQLMALDAVGLAPTPTPFASTWATQGYDLYAQGDVAGAMIAFQRAAQQQPDNVNYLYEYGRALIELYDPNYDPNTSGYATQATDLGDRMIQLAPNDPRGYVLKAKGMVWQDDAANAIPVALRGLEIDANYALTHAVLARAYTDIGRYQQGLTFGQQAVQLDPNDPETHRSYAIALIWVGDRENAIQQLEDAVNLNPNLTSTYFELAQQYINENLEEYGVATYERILSLEPFNAKALLRLCEVYFRVGQDQQAQGYCDDALQLKPDYRQAFRQRGMIEFRRRNYEGAIEDFQQCVALQSEEIQCYYLRGLAHYYLGDCTDAWNLLQDSLVRVESVADNQSVLGSIQEGLRLVTRTCDDYRGLSVPTVEPTTIPPTPIGGLGG